MPGDPKIQIDISAKDKASEVIADVADDAKKLEALSPEVTVTADTDQAAADLKALQDRADDALVIRAKIDQAEGELKRLKSELASVDDTAQATGRKLGDELEKGTTKAGGAVHSMAGNVIGDSAAMATGFGPLGEAVGQITEGVLGGEVAFKQLLSAGLAMGAVALVAKTVTDALAEAKAVDAFNKKKVEDFTKALREGKTVIDSLNDAFRETGQIEFADQVTGKTKDLVGVLAAANITFDEFLSKVALGKDGFKAWVIANGEAIGAGNDLNAIIQAGNQFIDDRTAAEKTWTDQMIVSGAQARDTKHETDMLNASYERGTDSIDHNTAATKAATTQVDRFAEKTASADIAYRRLIGALDEQQAWADVNAEIATYNQNTKHSEEETRAHIRAIADYVATTDTIPPAKKTEILLELNQNDVAAAEADITELTRQRDIKILLTAVGSKDTIKLLGGGGRQGTGIVAEAANAPAVTVNLPRGARYTDIQRAVNTGARRTGRRYGSPVGGRR